MANRTSAAYKAAKRAFFDTRLNGASQEEKLDAVVDGVIASQSPSHEALLIIVASVAAAFDRLGITHCDDPGEAIELLAEKGKPAALGAVDSAPIYELQTELIRDWEDAASDLRKDGCYSCCAGTYEHCAAHLKAAQPSAGMVPEGWRESVQAAADVMDSAKKLLIVAGMTMEGGTISKPYNDALDGLRTILSATPQPAGIGEPSGIFGEVVEIGDDEAGQPRILIHTTREAIKACTETLLFKPVIVIAAICTQEATSNG